MLIMAHMEYENLLQVDYFILYQFSFFWSAYQIHIYAHMWCNKNPYN